MRPFAVLRSAASPGVASPTYPIQHSRRPSDYQAYPPTPAPVVGEVSDCARRETNQENSILGHVLELVDG